MMTPFDYYEMLVAWKDCTPLRDISLLFDEQVYAKAVKRFAFDYVRWYEGGVDKVKLQMTPQLQVVLCYRIAHEMHDSNFAGKDKDVISLLGRYIGQCELFYSASIGPGLKINHGGGTVVGARCVIGANCLLHQGVTLGDKHGGRPHIGDNVSIYAGAKILGDISVGSNSIVGANAVVLNSFGENSVLVGAPAHNVKDK